MHEREASRGWVCTGCAVEASGRSRWTLYAWKDAGVVATLRVGRLTFWRLEELLEAEATKRAGRPRT